MKRAWWISPGLSELPQERFDLSQWSKARVNIDYHVVFDTAQDAEASRAVEVLGATIQSYSIPDDLFIHAIRVVRAGLHGFADIEGRGGFQMPQSVDESFLVLIDALDASLSNLGKQVKPKVPAASREKLKARTVLRRRR